ncbi:MAG: o-succinylbenzoate synthase [Anaerolineales bacterium]|nr:o-succinylbenzoate synthase [Anaerolineales bacterium]
MKIDQIELYHLEMPLAHPFETSFGLEINRQCILVAARADGLVGWGECVAGDRPGYSYETMGTAWHVLSEFLIPDVLGKSWQNMAEFLALSEWVRGHQMAKACLQAAAWDLLAQRDNKSLAAKLAEPYAKGPKQRVEVGVSIGIQSTVQETLTRIQEFLDQGYGRIKLKIKPGRDLDLAQAAREKFPSTPIMLDANSAFTLSDASIFQQMDSLNLLMIEQPLAHDDIYQHSKLQALLKTPICLDESIHAPAQAEWALDIDAGRIINIKPGRVGGMWQGREIHDICRKRNLPVWCGGMLETGVGRAANLAMASLPNFRLHSDISETARYWKKDIIDELFTLNVEDSTITVPSGPGLGVTVNMERVRSYQLRYEAFRP